MRGYDGDDMAPANRPSVARVTNSSNPRSPKSGGKGRQRGDVEFWSFCDSSVFILSFCFFLFLLVSMHTRIRFLGVSVRLRERERECARVGVSGWRTCVCERVSVHVRLREIERAS